MIKKDFKQFSSNKRNRADQWLVGFINQFFGQIMLILAVGVLVAGYYIVLYEQYNNYLYQKNVELVGLQEKNQQLAEENNLFITNQDKLIKFTAAEENLINLVLPEYFDLPSTIVQLNNMAKNYNIYINNMNINEDVLANDNNSEFSKFKKVNLELELFVSDYNDWKNFLAALENSAIIFNVMAIDFSNDSTIYKLNLFTYYY